MKSDKIRQNDDKNKRESNGTARNRLIANEYPFFEVCGVFVEKTIPEN